MEYDYQTGFCQESAARHAVCFTAEPEFIFGHHILESVDVK
jgi:hypothetical protein